MPPANLDDSFKPEKTADAGRASRGRSRSRSRKDGFEDNSASPGSSNVVEDSTSSSSSAIDPSGQERGKAPKRPSPGSDAFNLVPVTESGVVPGTYESVATPLRDKLTGEPTGALTLFAWENLGDSLLKIRGRAGWDVVEGCTPDVDALYAPQTITTTSINSSNGNISKLVAGQINSKVLSKDKFRANSAAAFTCTGFDGLFVAFNDGRDAYQPNTDTLLFLQGYKLDGGAVVVN